MPRYRIKTGSWTRGSGKDRKTFVRGDEVVCTEKQARVFGIGNLELLGTDQPSGKTPASDGQAGAPATSAPTTPSPASDNPAKASDVPNKPPAPATAPGKAPATAPTKAPAQKG